MANIRRNLMLCCSGEWPHGDAPTDPSGMRHAVRVYAGGAHEARCLALAEFRRERRDGAWGDRPGNATELTMEVQLRP